MTTKKTAFREDNYMNFATGLGTHSRDKRESVVVKKRNAREEHQTLDALYENDDLIFNIADRPADDATRAWLEVQGDSGSDIESQMRRLNARKAFKEAIVWMRLHGTGLIVVGTDSQLPLSEPMQPNEKPTWLKPMAVHEVTHVQFHSVTGDPEIYNFTELATDTPKKWNAHHSRVLRFDGDPPSPSSRTRERWGLSVVLRCVDVARDLDQAHASVANALQDFSMIVLKIKGLAQTLAEDKGGQGTRAGMSGGAEKRLRTMAMAKSVLGVMALEADDSFEEHGRSFAGLGEILDRAAERVSSAARMPMSVLMGRAPAGLNATGDSDLRWYYSTIQAMQETDLAPNIERLIQMITGENETPTYHWLPLWAPTEKEIADTRKIVAETDKLYIEQGVVDAEEIRMSRFTEEGWSMETEIDQSKTTVLPGDGLDDEIDDKPTTTPDNRETQAIQAATSINELSLAIERLTRAGDLAMVNLVRESLAKAIGASAPSPLTTLQNVGASPE